MRFERFARRFIALEGKVLYVVSDFGAGFEIKGNLLFIRYGFFMKFAKIS